jgi:phytoene dehydrogenase-like protein
VKEEQGAGKMEDTKAYDVIVVGGGIAGLTSAAYSVRSGCSTLLCEKGEKLGGLVNSFSRGGFTFDGGIRAFENSGIVFPMLRELGIGMEVVRNPVSIGIGDRIIRLRGRESLRDYGEMLCGIFPENKKEIEAITGEIEKVMGYMDVLYGIDNPLFMDEMMKDRGYLLKTILPWLARYKLSMRRVKKLVEPINSYLRKFTANQSLIDMITQHFFRNTPAFFALSYFGLYLDYSYPVGGTGVLARKMEEYIRNRGGSIETGTEISEADLQARLVRTADGRAFSYKKLIWCADMGRLYSAADPEKAGSIKVGERIVSQRELIAENRGGDSVLSLFIAVDLDKGFFEKICGSHMFYTPATEGLSSMKPAPEEGGRESLSAWMAEYLSLTTYEVSCPVLRDPSLAPEGKTGLIVSTLMDYRVAEKAADDGWYSEFKELCMEKVVEVLDRTVFPGFKGKVSDIICSTPVTLERLTGNSGGAITGWAFSEHLPSENRFENIEKAVFTPMPDVFQAGQWSYSPSGLPISVLTGKLAAKAACEGNGAD